jgi:hypothetical protein
MGEIYEHEKTRFALAAPKGVEETGRKVLWMNWMNWMILVFI